MVQLYSRPPVIALVSMRANDGQVQITAASYAVRRARSRRDTSSGLLRVCTVPCTWADLRELDVA